MTFRSLAGTRLRVVVITVITVAALGLSWMLMLPVKSILTRAMNQIPGSYGYASQRSIFGRNAGGSNSVQVEVVGTDMQRLKTSAAHLQKKLMAEFSKFAVRSDPMTFNEAGAVGVGCGTRNTLPQCGHCACWPACHSSPWSKCPCGQRN